MIDEYNNRWRYQINEQKSKSVDADGFRQIYIAKDKILSESQVFHNGKGKFGKEQKSPIANGGSNKYIYWPKNKADGTNNNQPIENSIIENND